MPFQIRRVSSSDQLPVHRLLSFGAAVPFLNADALPVSFDFEPTPLSEDPNSVFAQHPCHDLDRIPAFRQQNSSYRSEQTDGRTQP